MFPRMRLLFIAPAVLAFIGCDNADAPSVPSPSSESSTTAGAVAPDDSTSLMDSTGAATSTSTGASTGASASTSASGTTEHDNSSTTTGENVDDEGSTAECDRCIGEIPEGWSGPVARILANGSETPPDCGGVWNEEAGLLFSGVHAPAAACDCQCSAQPGNCSTSATLYMQPEGSPNCLILPERNYTFPPATQPATGAASGRRWRVSSGGVEPGSCLGESSPQLLPETTTGNVRLCNLSQTNTTQCADGSICAPPAIAPFLDEVCIWRDGDRECPAQYPDKLTYYREVDDSRGCTGCSCTMSGTATCQGRRATLILPQNIAVHVPPGECVLHTGASAAALAAPVQLQFTPGTPSTPTCTLSNPSTPTGQVQGTGARTVCCAS